MAARTLCDTLLGAALVVMADAHLKLVLDYYSDDNCTGRVMARGYEEFHLVCAMEPNVPNTYRKYSCSGEGEATLGYYSDSSCSNLTDSRSGCDNGVVAACMDVDYVGKLLQFRLHRTTIQFLPQICGGM